MKVKTTISVLDCLRCGHTWFPRTALRPRVCPKCHSAYWDIPRKQDFDCHDELITTSYPADLLSTKQK